MRRMVRRGESPVAKHPLSGQLVFLVGRLHGVTRGRVEQLIRVRGGKLASNPSTRVTLIVLTHSATRRALPDGCIRLPAGLPAGASMVSECGLRRLLTLLPPPDGVDRDVTAAQLERL